MARQKVRIGVTTESVAELLSNELPSDVEILPFPLEECDHIMGPHCTRLTEEMLTFLPKSVIHSVIKEIKEELREGRDGKDGKEGKGRKGKK